MSNVTHKNWRIEDNPRTRVLGIAGMQAIIEAEIAKGTYSVLVLDLDGLPAGPYTLTTADLALVLEVPPQEAE